MKMEGYFLIAGFFVIVGLIIGWAISKHASRRKKFIKTVLDGDKSLNIYLKGFNQKTAISLGQWVFIAVSQEKIRMYVEYVTSGTHANYDLFEIVRETIEEIDATDLSKNKVFVQIKIKTDKEPIELYLRLKPINEKVSVDSVISLFNTFKK